MERPAADRKHRCEHDHWTRESAIKPVLSRLSHREVVAERRWANMQAGAYQSGFEITSIDATSAAALRRLIETSVEPIYECHEVVHGVWRKKMTTDPRQPESGFTVSWTESVHTIDF